MRPAWRRAAGVLLTVAGVSSAWLSAQAMTVSTAAGLLRVKVPGFGFLDGPAIERLHDGQSLRVDGSIVVRDRPGGPDLARAEAVFTVSFDLWEERFAVTRAGTPPRSVSHLRSHEVEAWCLDTLTLPVADLGRLGRDAPFWVRLQYRAEVPAAGAPTDGAGFTLGSLIDALSRKRRAPTAEKTIEAGPFRLSG